MFNVGSRKVIGTEEFFKFKKFLGEVETVEE